MLFRDARRCSESVNTHGINRIFKGEVWGVRWEGKALGRSKTLSVTRVMARGADQLCLHMLEILHDR